MFMLQNIEHKNLQLAVANISAAGRAEGKTMSFCNIIES
jgi:hypothetical protein